MKRPSRQKKAKTTVPEKDEVKSITVGQVTPDQISNVILNEIDQLELSLIIGDEAAAIHHSKIIRCVATLASLASVEIPKVSITLTPVPEKETSE